MIGTGEASVRDQVVDGQGLSARPLIERKRLLRSIVPEQPSALLYADHIDRRLGDFRFSTVNNGSIP